MNTHDCTFRHRRGASMAVNRRILLQSIMAGLSGIIPFSFTPVSSAPHAGASSRAYTGLAWDKLLLNYKHAIETPQRLEAIISGLNHFGLIDSLHTITPLKNPLPWIQRIHTASHIQHITENQNAGPGALLAVAHVLGAVHAVASNTITRAFCAVRPPGHHAHNLGSEEGFCFFSNAAIGAMYAQHLGFKRILIIDWDYHHGNGTQDAFYSDPTVLFFSTHNTRDYPGTGLPRETGAGKGKGYTINVHLPCKTDDYAMLKAWETHLLPRVADFQPDFCIVSAGFDSKENDLLGCFRITPRGFYELTHKAMTIADTWCKGRLVSILEGGYADKRKQKGSKQLHAGYTGLQKSVLAHVTALLEREFGEVGQQ